LNEKNQVEIKNLEGKFVLNHLNIELNKSLVKLETNISNDLMDVH
jgi:hypothetical protein